MSGFTAATEWHEDEQTMEAETLEAILMDDVEVTSRTCPREYQIKCLPHPNGEGDNHVEAKLIFTIPSTYPEVVPEVKVDNLKGLVSKQCDALREHILEKAAEDVGMAMIYTLVEVAREWLIENNIAAGDGSMHGEMLRRLHLKEVAKKKVEAEHILATSLTAEEEEEKERNRQKILDGTAVTPETFAAWKARFDAEMEAIQAAKVGMATAKAASDGMDKPTGKEMFLRNLVGTMEEEELVAAAAEGVEGGVEVMGELFEGDDDDDDSDFELDSDGDDDDDDDDDDEEEEEEAPRARGGGGKKGGGR